MKCFSVGGNIGKFFLFFYFLHSLPVSLRNGKRGGLREPDSAFGGGKKRMKKCTFFFFGSFSCVAFLVVAVYPLVIMEMEKKKAVFSCLLFLFYFCSFFKTSQKNIHHFISYC